MQNQKQKKNKLKQSRQEQDQVHNKEQVTVDRCTFGQSCHLYFAKLSSLTHAGNHNDNHNHNESTNCNINNLNIDNLILCCIFDNSISDDICNQITRYIMENITTKLISTNQNQSKNYSHDNTKQTSAVPNDERMKDVKNSDSASMKTKCNIHDNSDQSVWKQIKKNINVIIETTINTMIERYCTKTLRFDFISNVYIIKNKFYFNQIDQNWHQMQSQLQSQLRSQPGTCTIVTSNNIPTNAQTKANSATKHSTNDTNEIPTHFEQQHEQQQPLLSPENEQIQPKNLQFSCTRSIETENQIQLDIMTPRFTPQIVSKISSTQENGNGDGYGHDSHTIIPPDNQITKIIETTTITVDTKTNNDNDDDHDTCIGINNNHKPVTETSEGKPSLMSTICGVFSQCDICSCMCLQQWKNSKLNTKQNERGINVGKIKPDEPNAPDTTPLLLWNFDWRTKNTVESKSV